MNIIITILSSSWCDKKGAVNFGYIKKEKTNFKTASGYAKRLRIGRLGSGRRQRSFLIIFRRFDARAGGRRLAGGMPFEDDGGDDDRRKR